MHVKLPGSMRPRDDAEETTPEITGEDAGMDQADMGDAGNGADPYGADLTGGPPREIEEEPDEHDITPDRIERFPGAGPEADEDDVTARPDERPPIDLSELP
jgi:hypothetical protein